MAREINSKIYDENIIRAGINHHIDNYYEPITVSMRKRIETVIGALDPKPNEKILDIGCGVGTFAFHCAKTGAISTGIDYSPESIKTAVELNKKYGTDAKTTFVVGSALKLPFEDSSFDKVVSADFIEHITDNEKIIFCNEMARVVKPGGIMVVFTPNKIRESIGNCYWTARHLLFKDKIPFNDLHYGLITRNKFEKILKDAGLKFDFQYVDTIRPFLSRLPVFRTALSLDLLWTIRK